MQRQVFISDFINLSTPNNKRETQVVVWLHYGMVSNCRKQLCTNQIEVKHVASTPIHLYYQSCSFVPLFSHSSSYLFEPNIIWKKNVLIKQTLITVHKGILYCHLSQIGVNDTRSPMYVAELTNQMVFHFLQGWTNWFLSEGLRHWQRLENAEQTSRIAGVTTVKQKCWTQIEWHL